MSNEISIAERRNLGFLHPFTLEEAIKTSELLAASGLCPVAYKGKPGDILVAINYGQEIGLKTMASLQNIAVINGKPSLYGDAMLAVCRLSRSFQTIEETYDVNTTTYTCVVFRKNEPAFVYSFSMADAKTAGLWQKAGPWTTYPKRMLQLRARGFALRDAFPDILKGIIMVEEVEDYENLNNKQTQYKRPIKDVGVTLDNNPEQEELINEEQIIELQQLVDELKGDLSKTCKHLNIESVEHMNVDQWSVLIRQFSKKVIEKRKLENLPINMHVQEMMSDDAKEFFGDENE
jgi:hypothetical protein